MRIYSLYLTNKFHHVNYTFFARKIEKLKINYKKMYIYILPKNHVLFNPGGKLAKLNK
jgi:hypothetical protein